MHNETVLDLPLFIHINSPISVYVFNNNIIVFKEWYGYDRYAYRAFELLHEIFNSSEGKKTIPQKLHKHFIDEKIPEEIPGYHCLIGTEFPYPDGHYLCLKCELEVTSDKQLPILLNSFTLEGKKLNLQIRLSMEDAFLIFANQCVDYYKLSFLKRDSNKDDNYIFSRKQLENELNTKLDEFTADYLEYIRRNLDEGKLKPIQILRAGGIATLELLVGHEAILQLVDEVILELDNLKLLSQNSKILYYTFLVSLLESDSISKPLRARIKEKSALFKEIYNELKKEFS